MDKRRGRGKAGEEGGRRRGKGKGEGRGGRRRGEGKGRGRYEYIYVMNSNCIMTGVE